MSGKGPRPPKPFTSEEEATIRRLCRRSFTGGDLSTAESRKMEALYRRNEDEYVRITGEVREEERSRIRGY